MSKFGVRLLRTIPRALALIAFTAGVVRGQTLDAAAARSIDQLFARWDRTDSPGCSIGIARDGAVVYARGYGMSDLQHGVPITPSSIFHVASVSKQFAAFAVAILAEEGKLRLDDEVRRHVPELPAYERPITIRQLMHHTSGLRDQWQLLGMAGWRFPTDLITEQDVLETVSRQRRTNFAPGAEWVYSNTGFTLLAVIVRRVTGQSLREFAHQRFFAPLGMAETHFHDDYSMVVPQRTSAYEPRGDGWAISIPTFNTYGATSLFTTPRDLLRWEAHLDNPTHFSRAVVDAAQQSGVLTSGRPTGYGYGLAVGTYRGLQVVGHSGSDAGYRANVERLPDRRLAVAIACNAANAAPPTLSRRVLDVLLGATAPNEASPIDTVPRSVSGDVLRRWAGTYRDTVSEAILRLRLVGDSLRLGDGRRVVPTSDSTARIAGATQGFVFRSARGRRFMEQRPATTRDLVYIGTDEWQPSRTQLGALVGSYSSREIDATYHVVLDDSLLVVRQRKMADVRLVPADRDAFTGSGGRVYRFARVGGRVTGFTLSDGRVRHLRFDRTR